MIVCLGIIEDALGRKAVFKNYDGVDSPFILERCEIYRGAPVLMTGILYLTRPEELPEMILIQEGTAMICVGPPPEHYKKMPLHLLALEEPADLADISNEVNRIFFEYNVMEQKLQDSVNKGYNIQHMVETIAPYLNSNELLVLNDEYRIIAHSNPTIHSFEISGLNQPDIDGWSPSEIMTSFKNDINFSKVRYITEPYFYEPSHYVCRAVCINIFHRDEFACRITISEDRNTFRGYEAGLLRFFASFIQLVYDLSIDRSDIFPRNHMANIFSDLLNGEAVDDRRLENSITMHGWSLSDPFLCSCVMLSDSDYYNRTIPYYCQVFNSEFSGCCFFEYEHSIVCVANLKYYNGSDEGFISAHINTLRDGYFRAGYSNVFTDISNLHNYYLQARIAIQTGLNKQPSIWFHRFADTVLSYLEVKLTEEIDGRFMCAPEIIKLNNYDKVNQTDYLNTLKVYLENHMNGVKTAKKLFIHRNSMEYRLNRIVELTGIDFENYDQVLYLNISIRFLLKELLP
jgi:hypothetical protein